MAPVTGGVLFGADEGTLGGGTGLVLAPPRISSMSLNRSSMSSALFIVLSETRIND